MYKRYDRYNHHHDYRHPHAGHLVSGRLAGAVLGVVTLRVSVVKPAEPLGVETLKTERIFTKVLTYNYNECE